jgi:hypothetical protein
MRDTTVKKVIKVIKSMNFPTQLPAVKRYVELYLKLHGNKNKWVIEKIMKNKIENKY